MKSKQAVCTGMKENAFVLVQMPDYTSVCPRQREWRPCCPPPPCAVESLWLLSAALHLNESKKKALHAEAPGICEREMGQSLEISPKVPLLPAINAVSDYQSQNQSKELELRDSESL